MLSRFDKSINSYQMALKLNPESAECHFNIASAFNDNKQHVKAQVHFETALQFNPDNADCHFELGKLAELIGSDMEK